MRAGTLLWICFCLIPLTSHAAAIHDAAKKGDMAAIAAALDAGANVNEPDAFATPLYYAVSRQHLDAAKLLIDRGADVNAGSKIGGPPLKAAVAKSKLELITLLLEHGADPNVAVGDRDCSSRGRPAWLPGLRQGAGRSGGRCQRARRGRRRADADPSCQVLRLSRDIRISHGERRRAAEARTDRRKAGFRRCREGPGIFRQELRRRATPTNRARAAR